MQFVRFVAVGTLGTAAYAGLYLALIRVLEPTLVLAWLAATVLTNLAHRLVTFDIRGQPARGPDAAVFLLTALIGLGVAKALITIGSGSDRLAAVAMIVAGTGLGGILRFVLMRIWVKRRYGGDLDR